MADPLPSSLSGSIDSQPLMNRYSDHWIIGTVGFAHAISHFFQLLLPALFPWFKDQFSVSYVQLGTLTVVFFAVSGIGQTVAGFIVDRFGALRTLVIGVSLLIAGGIVATITPVFSGLYVAAALIGLGNCVFHPSDFSILNHRIQSSMMGHAFSWHALGGNLGYAVAPLLLPTVAMLTGRYQSALILGVCLAICAMIGLIWRRRDLTVDPITMGDTTELTHHEVQKYISPLHIFLRPSVLSCFFFFMLAAMVGMGIQNFVPSLLHIAYDLPRLWASYALTGYLIAGAIGMLWGGFWVTKVDNHRQSAMSGMLLAGGLMAMIGGLTIIFAQDEPVIWLGYVTVVLLWCVGLIIGLTNPMRDMMVKQATPKQATGRVYGLVYSGLDVGSACGPILFATALDFGLVSQIWLILAGLLFLNVGVVFWGEYASQPHDS
jgi:FSR family fosmidomycin resistance protein-like MFS transporter